MDQIKKDKNETPNRPLYDLLFKDQDLEELAPGIPTLQHWIPLLKELDPVVQQQVLHRVLATNEAKTLLAAATPQQTKPVRHLHSPKVHAPLPTRDPLRNRSDRDSLWASLSNGVHRIHSSSRIIKAAQPVEPQFSRSPLQKEK